tara:strand:- start:652 stop:1569 length:918 start_codon:yes stop_codon:yes gene_type:complete
MAIAPEEGVDTTLLPKGVVTTTSGIETAANYGISEALLNDPIYGSELSAVYAFFKSDNVGAALEALFKTKYYTTLSGTVRARLKEKTTQNPVYLDSLSKYGLSARKRLVSSGIKMSQTEFDKLVQTAYDSGMDDNQLDQLLITSGSITGFGGNVLGDTSALKNYAASFGVSNYLNSNYWGQKQKDLFAGTVTIDDIQAEIRMKSASAFPAYADQINNGVSVDSIASSYKSAISTILEKDPDSVTYNDPHLRQALQSISPEGKPITKPLWQFERELRATKEWEYTNNARDTMDNMSMRVLRDMGLA